MSEKDIKESAKQEGNEVFLGTLRGKDVYLSETTPSDELKEVIKNYRFI
jgi:hypothetical protein